MKNSVFFLFCLAVLGAFPCVVSAESRVIPDSKEQVTLSFSPVVKKVAPAVVNIYTRKLVKQRILAPFFDDPLFQQFFGGSLPEGLSRQRMENSLGSGVVVGADGLIVTNNHVISGADQITVVLHDRREFDATLMTADERSDLAILRLNTKEKNFPYVELTDSDSAEVGDMVLAIGNPFGVGQTVTSGIVSAIARTEVDINDLNYFIQTDAAINPGNSGGALVGLDGRLLGINSAIFTRSGGNMGIGFAIPSNLVRSMIQAVAEGKKTIVRPWTGIRGQSVTAELATSLSLPKPVGMLVNEVSESSPAKKAGLRAGDVIVGVNGKPIEDPESFRYRIAMLPVGTKASLEVLRSGHELGSLTFDLIAPPETPPRDTTVVKGGNPLVGSTLENVSPAVAEELGLRSIERGVVVTKIATGSSAARLGFKVGDVILMINDEEIVSVKDALAKIQARAARWQISIRRGDRVVNLVIR